ncbi:hypothetical protein [Microbispora sp. CSR-4]|uniref:ATP-binding protein n=1 Tax=Microbispora sp. CSR-4 TaxID=2592813 RepID=UPI0011CB84DD|nr:hypothetical protein [Microbispora sp. CSR-4]
MRSSLLRSVPRVDLLIGLAIIALGTLEAFTDAMDYGAARSPELWWVGQALVTGVLVWYRRRAPVAVFILMILAQYAWHRQGNESCPVWQLAALLIVFHTIGAHLSVRHGGAWALAGVLIFDSGAVDHRFLPFQEVVYLTVMFGSAYLTGLALRGYLLRAHRMSERAMRLELERERRAAEAVAAERNRIAYHPERLELEITDNGAGAGPALSTGNGLIGMRERAELFGGSLDAGPLPEGGYRVRATLPIAQGVPVSEAAK